MKLKWRYFIFIAIVYFFFMFTFYKNFTHFISSQKLFIIHTALFQPEHSIVGDISLISLLSLKFAKIIGQPDRLKFYYNKLPYGPHFNQAQQYIDELEQVVAPREVFGNPIQDLTHAKDVFQLQTLLKYGGAFLDLDIFALQNLRPLFVQNDFVMGNQSDKHLVAAMVIAKKDSKFLNRWYQGYKTFNDSLWDIHSGQVSKNLSQMYPKEIKVLTLEEMAQPGPSHEGMRMAFLDRSYNYSKNYVTHLWSHMSNLMLAKIDIQKILTIDNSFFCQIRHLISDIASVFIPSEA